MTIRQPGGRNTAKHTAGNRRRAVKAYGETKGIGARPQDFEAFCKMGPLEQRRQIREGMKAIIVKRVAEELLHIPVQLLLSGLGLPGSTILRKISKKERLTSAELDRIARVLYVFEQAVDVGTAP
jgi:uncharacterized protein (DUF2384 family)